MAEFIPLKRTPTPRLHWGVLGVALLLAFYPIAVSWWASGRGDDLDIYLSAAAALGDDPGQIYGWAHTSQSNSPYLYPPFLAALMVPLTWVSRSTAFFIVAAIEVAAAATVIWSIRHRSRGELLLAVAVLLVPLAHNLYFGQVNLTVLACVALAALSLEKGKDGRAGALLALGGLIKLLPFGLLLLLVSAGRLRTLRGFVPALAAGVLLPSIWLVPRYGAAAPVECLAIHVEYVDHVVFGHAKNFDPHQVGGEGLQNHSLPAVTSRLARKITQVISGNDLAADVRNSWRLFGVAIGLALLGLACAVSFRRRPVERFQTLFGASFLLLVLTNITTWNHHLGVLALLPWRGRHAPWAAAAVPLGIHLPFLVWLYPNYFPAVMHPSTHTFLDWGCSTAFMVVLALTALWSFHRGSDVAAAETAAGHDCRTQDKTTLPADAS